MLSLLLPQDSTAWKKDLPPEDIQNYRSYRRGTHNVGLCRRTGWTWPKMGSVLLTAVFIALHFATGLANPDSKRLYDDLLSNYNRLIRPVGNNSDRLTVKMGLRLSQLIDVNLKNQIMTTNVWVEQVSEPVAVAHVAQCSCDTKKQNPCL
ncbi:hypothetical protein RP20_CCG008426 [Aedes albopictus]|nr:hypothetical protein RP20_CCG008426 [Aedes albopictus]